MVHTHNDVIELLGGPIQAARKLGQKADTVRRWRLKNRIPSAHWLDVERVLSPRVTVAKLAQMAPKDRRAA